MRRHDDLENTRRFPLKGIRATGRAILVVATLAIPITANAASVACGPRAEILRQLASQYSEAPTAVGLANNGSLVEVLTNADGSTWTIILSQPNGASCFVAAGESWQDVKRIAGGEFGI